MRDKIVPAPHLYFYWNAFSHLSDDRQVGMAVGRIPWTALDRYAARHSIDDPDQFELFVRFVRAMDAAFVASMQEEGG